MNTILQENGLISLEEAAKYLGVSKSTFRQHYSNKLNDVKHKIGKRAFFPKSSLIRFLKSNNAQN